MEFCKVVALAGPNVWTHSGALEAWLDLAAWSEATPAAIELFQQRLVERLPALAADGEGSARRAYAATLAGGLRLARLLEGTTAQLLSMAGPGPRFSRTRATLQPHRWQVIVACQEERLGRG